MAKILIGKVISTKMQGTVVVEVTRRTPHPLYKKLLKRSNHFKVDPNGQTLVVGQNVKIVETKPQAKGKYFKVQEVIADTHQKKEAVK